MTVSINLMKPAEFRRQGAVSGAFVVRVSVASLVAFALVFGLLGLVRFRISRQDLIDCRAIWTMREPIYNQILAMKQDLATAKKLQREMRGWTASRINWGDPLLELQQIVPASMQLRQLNIRGDIEFKQPSGPAPEGGEGPAPSQPIRRYYLLIEGRATGNMAENTVVQFVRTLGEASTFKTFLESKKLQSLQRDSSQGVEQMDRAFIIEAITIRKPMVAKEPAVPIRKEPPKSAAAVAPELQAPETGRK